jgi:imidazolonepropionase-like amidohydrolase
MHSRSWAQLLSLGLAACAGAAPIVDTSPPPLIIEDVTVVDVIEGRLVPHTDVVITGERITRLEPHRDDRRRPAGGVVDGRGKFLIPGLWDMHVHALWDPRAVTNFLPLFVTQGVTGVRDMGGSLELLREARDSVAQGAPYPSVIGAGPIIDGPEPVQRDISVAVGDTAQARRVVDSLADGGADFIKVYTLLPKGAFLAVLEEASRRRLAVVGHVPADLTPAEAARLGQRSIEHLRDEIEPYCTRQTADQCTPQLAEFKRYGVWQVPTLHALRMKSLLDDSSLDRDPRMEFLMPAIRQEWRSIQASRAGRGAAYFEGKRARVEDELWLTGRIFRDQRHVLAGTDTGVEFSYPGFSLHDELALLVQAGLSPLDALRAATIEPARFFGIEDTVGSVGPGRRADLVLLNQNPLADIAATRSIETVVLRGRLLDRPRLDSLLAAIREAARQ